jgi:hypothetical protein
VKPGTEGQAGREGRQQVRHKGRAGKVKGA